CGNRERGLGIVPPYSGRGQRAQANVGGSLGAAQCAVSIQPGAGDMKHALRRLRRAPAFTAAVLLTLGLGIGANTSIASAIYSLLLKPLPYADAERLAALSLTGKDKRSLDASLLTILDWREQSKTL